MTLPKLPSFATLEQGIRRTERDIERDRILDNSVAIYRFAQASLLQATPMQIEAVRGMAESIVVSLNRCLQRRRCERCMCEDTPEWRRGPNGARTLCNACGLHYAKASRHDNAKLQSKEGR